ncbi:hypothetical protein ACIQAC_13285 [Streptomyces sp. NPDC088387]|uniref:hypothetical protein n=1 Tax=Streptomyces sp. NPDC088387 TaxID=3365859 RepID=UPI00382E6529
MSATENQPEPRQGVSAGVAAGVSMSDLLAACAAAELISTPPRAPLPTAPRRPADHTRGHGHREAA